LLRFEEPGDAISFGKDSFTVINLGTRLEIITFCNER